MSDLLRQLMAKHAIETREAKEWHRIYRNDTPLGPLDRDLRALYGNRLPSLNIGLGKLVSDSTTDLVRLVALQSSAGDPVDNRVWDEYNRLGMDRLSAIAHNEASVTGRAYYMVGLDFDGQPLVTVESSTQVTVLRDPATMRIVAWMKRWRSDERTITTQVGTVAQVDTYRSSTSLVVDGVDSFDVPMGGREELVSSEPNTLKAIPLVMLTNSPSVTMPDGRSDLADVKDLLMAIAKIGTDLLLASEANAIPHRILAAPGELSAEQAAHLQEVMSRSLSAPAAAKVGVLSGGATLSELRTASLDNFDRALRLLIGQTATVGGLPAYFVSNDAANPTSADSVRAQAIRLTNRAKARQRWWGPAYADLMRLVFLVKDGYADPRLANLTPVWESPEPSSLAQQADAVSKLVGSNVLDTRAALESLNLAPTEVERILSALPVSNPPAIA